MVITEAVEATTEVEAEEGVPVTDITAAAVEAEDHTEVEDHTATEVEVVDHTVAGMEVRKLEQSLFFRDLFN